MIMENNFEEKYKNALEKGRQWYNVPDATDVDRDLLCSMFPELEDENREERIREDIKKVLANVDLSIVRSSFSDMVEWLNSKSKCPLYKVGQWLVDRVDGTVIRITKVRQNTYEYGTVDGGTYSCSHGALETDTRPWTLEDAKDGDVLHVDDNELVIFHRIEQPNMCVHCTLTDGVKFNIRVPDEPYADPRFHEVRPATCSEREMMMSAMEKHGGYKWVPETKSVECLIVQSSYDDAKSDSEESVIDSACSLLDTLSEFVDGSYSGHDRVSVLDNIKNTVEGLEILKECIMDRRHETVIPEKKMIDYIKYCSGKKNHVMCCFCDFRGDVQIVPYYFDETENDVYFASVCPKCGKLMLIKE